MQEKSIPADIRFIDVGKKPQEFLNLFRSITSNPDGKGTVPTIIDDDVRLTESHVVSEYLDTQYPKAGTKMFPTDASDLAKVKLFVELSSSEVETIGWKILKADSQEVVNAGKEALIKGLKVLDSFLKDHGREGGDFLLGKDFSYAEAATIPFIHWFSVSLNHYHSVNFKEIISENGLHRLDKWIEAVEARPSVKASTLGDELLIQGFGKWVNPLFKK